MRIAWFRNNPARLAILFRRLSMTGTKQTVLQTPAPFETSGGPQKGVQTMTIAKRLMISAVTALALGVGPAMAQVPSAAEGAYYSQQATPRIQNGWSGPVQSGSSDIEPAPQWRYGHIVPFNGNYTTLASPG
jgi:hypothetical protein